jgi:hypothetical protein
MGILECGGDGSERSNGSGKSTLCSYAMNEYRLLKGRRRKRMWMGCYLSVSCGLVARFVPLV